MHSPGIEHNLTHMCNFLDPCKYVRALPKPQRTSHSPVFPLWLLTSPLCATIIHCLRQPQCWAVTCECFWQILPRGKILLPRLNCKSRQIKTALLVSSFREPPDRTNNDSSLTVGLWRSSTPFSVAFGGCQTTDFYHNCGLFIFKAPAELGKGYGSKAN